MSTHLSLTSFLFPFFIDPALEDSANGGSLIVDRCVMSIIGGMGGADEPITATSGFNSGLGVDMVDGGERENVELGVVRSSGSGSSCSQENVIVSMLENTPSSPKPSYAGMSRGLWGISIAREACSTGLTDMDPLRAIAQETQWHRRGSCRDICRRGG